MKVSMSSIHLQAVFSAQCKITSFPVDAQTPSAPHSGTESRRSTETRTAQSGAASEDSAHGYQFASAAASPSQTPSPRQTRPDVSRPTQRDESSHMGGQTATRRKSPYHPPAHAVRRAPYRREALRPSDTPAPTGSDCPCAAIYARGIKHAPHFRQIRLRRLFESWVVLLQDGFGDDYSALKGACQM